MSALIQAFESRFSFLPPEAYTRLAGGGVVPGWPVLPEIDWLKAEDVAGFEFKEHQWDDFAPFARSACGDLWCWCPLLEKGGRVPVGHCAIDCEQGVVYAPDFSTALFRLVIDAAQLMSGIPAGEAEARQLLAAAAVQPLTGWPAPWRDWLAEASRAAVSVWRQRGGVVEEAAAQSRKGGWFAPWRDWLGAAAAPVPFSMGRQQDGVVRALVSRAEYDRVVSEWIDDGEVGSTFRWMVAP